MDRILEPDLFGTKKRGIAQKAVAMRSEEQAAMCGGSLLPDWFIRRKIC